MENMTVGLASLLTDNLSGPRCCSGFGGLVVSVPMLDPAMDHLFVLSVSLLDQADELVVVAFNPHQIVIGEPAPLLLELSLKMIPISFELFASHSRSSF
jgi:hypothetical protein